MCREHCRAAHPRMLELCREHGVELTSDVCALFARRADDDGPHLGDVGAACLKLCGAGADGYVKRM